MLKNFKVFIASFAVLGTFFLSGYTQTIYANSTLEQGDFFQAYNNTTQEGTWRDPVSAKAGEIVEFRVRIYNNSNEVAHRVQVWGAENGLLPQSPALKHVVTARIANASYGGVEITDTATVNVSGTVPAWMKYLPGHVRVLGKTNLYPNCYPTPCSLVKDGKDTVGVLSGFEVGDVQPWNTVEVAYKAWLVGSQTPTPSATATPTPILHPPLYHLQPNL